MARLDAYFLRQTGGFLSKGDGLMGDFYLASVGEFSRAPKQLGNMTHAEARRTGLSQ